MKIDVSTPIVLLAIIAGRKLKPQLLEALSEGGGRLATVIYAKGSVKADSPLLEAFGLIPEESKVFITCLMPQECARAAMDMLTNRFHFDRPNTGIAFTIPLEGLSH